MVFIRQFVGRKQLNRPWLPVLVALCFIAGLLIGSIGAESLNGIEILGLGETLDSYLQRLSSGEASGLFRQSLIKQELLVLQLLFFGTSVIGLPLILAVVLSRGFALGYTCCVIIKTGFGGGWAALLLGILPHTLLAVPLCLGAATWGGDWSLSLLLGDHEGFAPGTQQHSLTRRLSISLFFLAAALITAVAEGYLSPFLLRLLAA